MKSRHKLAKWKRTSSRRRSSVVALEKKGTKKNWSTWSGNGKGRKYSVPNAKSCSSPGRAYTKRKDPAYTLRKDPAYTLRKSDKSKSGKPIINVNVGEGVGRSGSNNVLIWVALTVIVGLLVYSLTRNSDEILSSKRETDANPLLNAPLQPGPAAPSNVNVTVNLPETASGKTTPSSAPGGNKESLPPLPAPNPMLLNLPAAGQLSKPLTFCEKIFSTVGAFFGRIRRWQFGQCLGVIGYCVRRFVKGVYGLLFGSFGTILTFQKGVFKTTSKVVAAGAQAAGTVLGPQGTMVAGAVTAGSNAGVAMADAIDLNDFYNPELDCENNDIMIGAGTVFGFLFFWFGDPELESTSTRWQNRGWKGVFLDPFWHVGPTMQRWKGLFREIGNAILACFWRIFKLLKQVVGLIKSIFGFTEVAAQAVKEQVDFGTDVLNENRKIAKGSEKLGMGIWKSTGGRFFTWLADEGEDNTPDQYQ